MTNRPTLPDVFEQSIEVHRAIQNNDPLVALESTVITHGLPRPQNLILAQDMEQTVRNEGALPATIAVMDGKIKIGLGPNDLERLAGPGDVIKVSLRDFATALTKNVMGGTTVAGTMFAAERAGIKVFATGGIGGVHKEGRMDISTDMEALASIPMIVVCAGAKSILDLPSTLEYLETKGVPVVGFGTDKFPAFFSTSAKNLKTSVKLDTPEEVVKFANTHWKLGMKTAVLVCQPVPASAALSGDYINPFLEQVSKEIVEKEIMGQQVTPYELGQLNKLTGGRSMRANLALLLNNAKLAAQIARYMVGQTHERRL